MQGFATIAPQPSAIEVSVNLLTVVPWDVLVDLAILAVVVGLLVALEVARPYAPPVHARVGVRRPPMRNCRC